MMRQAAIAAAILSLVAFSAPLLAGDELPGKKGKDEEFEVDFSGMGMEELISLVQRVINKTFIYDNNVLRLSVTFKGAKPIPRKAIFSVFKSILETNNYGISEVDIDGVMVCKISQLQQGFTVPAPTFSRDEIKANPEILPTDDTMVTVVYPLKYAEARQAANQLRAIVNAGRGGAINGIPNVNVLVVTALGSMMQRVFRIIELLDVPGPQPEWKVVRIRYADPETLSVKVESILQAESQQAVTRQLQAQPAGKLVPEPRTRSIIIQATADQFPRILSLIDKLDVELDKEPSLVHVVHLRHTNALDMEETINAIIQANPDIGRTESEPAPGAAPAPAPNVLPGRRTNRAPRMNRPRRTTSTGTTDEEQASAIADEATNSIIIVAPEIYFKELKRIIDRLDVRRPQVLIETLIAEVSSAKGLDLGVELSILDKAADGKVRGFGATAFGLSNIVDQDGNTIDLTSAGGTGAPIPSGRLPNWNGQGMTGGITAGSNFKIPVLLNLLGSDSDVNVLSLPRILTNANEEAEIKVLEEVPTSSSQSNAAVTNLQGFTGYQDAGVTLTITPHISENDSLRLEIHQTIEQFGKASAAVSGVVLPPQKTSREIQSEVTVPNHRTVILGGLTSKVSTEIRSKIPLLGDIPLIGLLFQNSQRKVEKTNLFVFITPHILSDPRFRDLERLSDEALNEAKALGADTSQIDLYNRASATREESLARSKAGELSEVMEYDPKESRK